MNKKRWIFLRGLTRGNVHWSTFPEIFQKLNPEAEMEFLEIPGNGLLHLESSPVDQNQLVEILRNKSHFVQQKKTFNLCGISLGGMAALKWIETYPHEIESIAVINASLSQYSPFHKRLIPLNYATLLRTLFNSNSFEQEEVILKITSNKFNDTKKNIEKFAAFSERHKVTKINFIRQLVLASLIKIESVPLVPFKVICSKNDRLVDYTCSRQLALKLGGEHYVHQTAGHDLPLDEPVWLSETLMKNLD